MRTTKIVLGVVAGMLLAFGAGWLMGSSGRGDLERAAQTAEGRADLLQARSSALAARVDLYNVNFGEASKHLEDAKVPLRHAIEQYKNAARTEDAARLGASLTQLEQAQQM